MRKDRWSQTAFFLTLLAMLTVFSAMGEGSGTEIRPETPSPTPVESVRPTPQPQAAQRPQEFGPSQGSEPPAAEEWNLILVNRWNPVPEDYELTLKKLNNNQSVDERCYPDLQDMIDACRAAGLTPVICSSYRTQEKQEELFEAKVKKWLAKGYDREEAEREASNLVAIPGTSEHQVGLAVDIVDINNQNLNEAQEDTAVQKWLMEHSWEYGFILRYPSDKSELTGISYEPWHYRYVGKDVAREIYEQGICLEEYLAERG